jgi:hypothetical protein
MFWYRDSILRKSSIFNNPWPCISWFDTVTKPTIAYWCIRLSHIINIATLLHVSAALVAILREMHYKGSITKLFERTHKCKMLIFTYIPYSILILSTFFYSPTDAPVNCLKNNFKIYIKINIKTVRHVSVLSVTPSSGSALFVLAKVTVVKIAN